jgi:hypothetical protein
MLADFNPPAFRDDMKSLLLIRGVNQNIPKIYVFAVRVMGWREKVRRRGRPPADASAGRAGVSLPPNGRWPE